MGFLAGKRFLITGVLSNRSIAYGIARCCRREGAELAFSYQGERFRDRVGEFAAGVRFGAALRLDVADDAQIERTFAQLGEAWPEFDGLVHSIGFAPRESIAGDFLEGLSRESFRIAHDISSYSFPALAKAAAPRLRPGAALLTLTYLGRAAQRSQLQHHGTGQGIAGSQRALPGEQPRASRRARQRHFGRADQDARGFGHQGLRQDPRGGRERRAAAPQRHDRRRRQRGRVPALGSRGRDHLRDHLCRRRLQPRHAGAPSSAQPRGRTLARAPPCRAQFWRARATTQLDAAVASSCTQSTK